MSNRPGTLYVVATPIGNLKDISARAIEVLNSVDLVAAEDTRHTRKLLLHVGLNKQMLSVHEHNEGRVVDRILGLLANGQDVALVSDAGTPLISDPGYPLIRACRERDIAVSPIPGPSALIAALSVSGLPTDRFLFLGFPPRVRSARITRFQDLADHVETLVFYESAHRIIASLEDMVAVFGFVREAFLAREISKTYEDLRLATLGVLLDELGNDEERQRGEFVVVVKGKPEQESTQIPADVLRLQDLLVEEMPLKKAAALISRFSGVKKNRLYKAGLERAVAVGPKKG